MEKRYYVAMAYDAGGFGQSDYLYLLKVGNGKIIGYSEEFEVATYDVADACSPDSHSMAKWMGWTGEKGGWNPAGLDEIKSMGLGKYVIGVKSDITVGGPITPLMDD